MLKAAREDGIKVPEDLSLVGVDDIIAELLEPPLTSVVIPTYEAGERLLLFCSAGLRKKILLPREVVLEEKLVVRKSTRGRV